jgi:hypothetical protein
MLPGVWDHLLVPVGAVVDLGDVLAEAALTRDHQVVEGHAQLPIPRVLYTTPKLYCLVCNTYSAGSVM